MNELLNLPEILTLEEWCEENNIETVEEDVHE